MVIAAVDVETDRQGIGRVADIRSVHPKEHNERLLDWIMKGKAPYLHPEKSKAFLQDSAPANWEQYEERLAQQCTISAGSLRDNTESASAAGVITLSQYVLPSTLVVYHGTPATSFRAFDAGADRRAVRRFAGPEIRLHPQSEAVGRHLGCKRSMAIRR